MHSHVLVFDHKVISLYEINLNDVSQGMLPPPSGDSLLLLIYFPVQMQFGFQYICYIKLLRGLFHLLSI